MILAMLVALQGWRARGSWWLLALGLLAAVAAPLFWSAGYTAGLVGMAYLWADGRRSCRIAAAAPLAASLATAALVWVFAGQAIAANSHLHDGLLRDVMNLPIAAAHSAQAICEALILNNLGLDAPTAAAQAIVLCLGLAGIWALSRHRSTFPGRRFAFRANPLEAAGAVLVVANFGMVFAVRGTETTFDNLRALGWYDAIPQLGAVVFAAGWWSGTSRLVTPQVDRAAQAARPRGWSCSSSSCCSCSRRRAPTVSSSRTMDWRPRSSTGDHAGSAASPLPRRSGRRGHARSAVFWPSSTPSSEPRASKGSAGSALRSSVGRTIVPGMPETVAGLSALDLLDIPDTENPAGIPSR